MHWKIIAQCGTNKFSQAKANVLQTSSHSQQILLFPKSHTNSHYGACSPLLLLSLPQIVFYEGRCFSGRKLEVYGDCDNFLDRGFMNRVNSIRVESGAWICYNHPDFKGQQYILERGEYPEFQCWNSHNDHMGSCRTVRMHGEHYRIQLFDSCNYMGQCIELCDDCPFLQSFGYGRTCVNSIRVYGDG
ncbi:hypothetical protein P4O66_010125, partial [Electrophorus voltai]